jgi:tRNA 2-thiocytidine biosynthesis protein TtcA
MELYPNKGVVTRLKASEWRPYNKDLFAKMRRASREFGLIEEGDCIAVGLSGGKDSTLLLYAMAVLQRTLPCDFSLRAVSLDLGWGNDYSEMAAFCDRLGVPLEIIPSEIGPLIFEERKEKNPCSLCARMRRGAINNWAHDNGCNKVALGHHMDDCIETLLMSLFYEGRIHTFAPRSYLTRSQVTVIRPLVYVSEADITRIGARLALPLVKNKCPADGHTTRSETKDLLASLAVSNPRIKERIMSGIDKDLWQHYRITPSEEE